MKHRAVFLGLFFPAMLLCLNACGTLQIVSEKKPVSEPVVRERPAAGKPSPAPAEGRPERPPEKSFLQRLAEKISPPEVFARTFPVEFSSFHPRANSALQDYARTRKGNAFQVARLGGEEVILKGHFRSEGSGERFAATLTAKPAGPKKSRLEIRMTPVAEPSSADNLEAAAEEIFAIVEKSFRSETP